MANILVVDDEKDILEVLKDILVEAGHRVAVSTNGKHAVELAENEPFDLLLTDLIMPDKEGISIIREIRKTDSSIAIIAMSGGGYAEPAFYLETAEGFGADITLTKPFTRVKLLNTIDQILNR